jgi:hypothetical protein
MTNDKLTSILAERIMEWSIGPDRFMMGGRRWLPRWRFQPVKRIADAMRLLEKASPETYAMDCDESGTCHVQECGKR